VVYLCIIIVMFYGAAHKCSRLVYFISNAEAAAKTGMILLLGEITSKTVVDYQKIVRDTVRKIGYDDTSKGDSTLS